MPGIHKKKPIKRAMGGEAGESLRKGKIFKEKRDKRRESVDEMIERVYGKGPFDPPQKKPRPKKKPKNPNRIKPKKKPINPETRKPKGFGFKGPQGGGKLTRQNKR